MEKLVTITEAADNLGFERHILKALRDRNQLFPSSKGKAGKSLLYDYAELIAWSGEYKKMREQWELKRSSQNPNRALLDKKKNAYRHGRENPSGVNYTGFDHEAALRFITGGKLPNIDRKTRRSFL